MKDTASGEPKRIRYDSLAGLRGFDSPSPSQFLPLCMHRAMHAQIHGTQEHPSEKMCAHRHAHRDSRTGMYTLSTKPTYIHG